MEGVEILCRESGEKGVLREAGERIMWVSKQRVCQTEKTAVQRPWGMGNVGKFQE